MLRRLLKLLIIFLAFKGVVLLAYLVYEHFPLQLIHFEHFAIEDVEFNDIFYSVRQEVDDFNKEVVLINSGSLPLEHFRENLVGLIEKTVAYQPVCIGLDFYFESRKDPFTDSLLQETIRDSIPVVLAFDLTRKHSQVFITSHRGFVNYPSKRGESVRHYQYYSVEQGDTVLSFAAQLARFRKPVGLDRDSIRYLKYSSRWNGYFPALRSVIQPQNFPALEATEVLSPKDSGTIRNLIQNKIVIIGHLGRDSMNQPFDLEDRFRVPTDSALINRLPIMPGAVIHANAVQMLLSGNDFIEVSGWKNTLVTSIVLFLFLIVFYYLHHRYKLAKLYNLLIVLGCTIPLIYLCCIRLMEAGIYYKVGFLFMQIAFLEEFVEIADGFEKKFFRKERPS